MSRPEINVTPLIDVLLVLLIIFMVVTPVKPTAFKAKVPIEPNRTDIVKNHPDTLVVVVEADSDLRINNETSMGSIREPQRAIDRLKEIFAARVADRSITGTVDQGISRAVFIKAPTGIDYGSVAKVIDAVKLSGADPIALQIDDLN